MHWLEERARNAGTCPPTLEEIAAAGEKADGCLWLVAILPALVLLARLVA